MLGILGDQASDDKRGVVGNPGVGLDFPDRQGRGAGQNNVVVRSPDNLILSWDRGRNGSVDLKRNLRSVLIDPRTDGQFDPGRNVPEINRAHVVFDELRVGDGNFLRDVDVGHSIIEGQHARAGKNLGGSILNESLQADVELTENIGNRGIQLGFARGRIGNGSNHQAPILVRTIEFAIDEI